MITFDDINLEPHSMGYGVHGKIFFPNGYGLSIVRFRSPFGGGSYTSDDREDYEVAIIKGTKDKWDICYETNLTDNVLARQSKEDINQIIKRVIRLC
jgi:hypothetical protein